jgi:hypothetical protein
MKKYGAPEVKLHWFLPSTQELMVGFRLQTPGENSVTYRQENRYTSETAWTLLIS